MVYIKNSKLGFGSKRFKENVFEVENKTEQNPVLSQMPGLCIWWADPKLFALQSFPVLPLANCLPGVGAGGGGGAAGRPAGPHISWLW